MKRVTLVVFLAILSTSLIAQNGPPGSRVWTLKECVDQAVANSLTIKRSGFTVETSKVDLHQSRAAMIPTLNGSATYGYNWGRSINPVTNLFTTQEINSNNLALQSSVTLFNGLRIQETMKQSKSTLAASEYDLAKTKNDVMINIVTLYLTVVFNKELYQTAQLQLNSSQQQYERTKKQVEAGALPKSDELNLDAQVATNELNLINRENALNLSFLQLKQAMLIPASTNLDVEVPVLNAEDLVLDASREEIYQTSLQVMPEIKSAEFKIQSSVHGLRAAKGNLYPRLSLNGNITTNYSSASDFDRFVTDGGENIQPQQIGYVQGSNAPVFRDVSTPTGTYTDGYGRIDQFKDNVFRAVSLSLSIPIFNGLQTRSSIQRAQINTQQAEINSLETKNQLRQSVETAYNDALAASKTYNSSQRQVNSREEAFRMMKQRYELGAANYVEYQVSENDLFQAKSDMTRAKYDFIFKKKILDFYQGKPIEF
ncbi:MAG: TolC family protein [Cyclobacteriaceae bacterium]|nr:TolC family protein [Cyclobacteriaceae bacterium]